MSGSRYLPIFRLFSSSTRLLARKAQKSLLPSRKLFFAGGAATFAFSLAVTAHCEENSKGKPKNFDLIVRETDQLYENYLIDNAYAILRRFKSSDCSELLWRLARVLCEKGKLSRDPEEKKALMYEAYEVVQKAVEHEPREGCFGAHKWLAILLDYIGEIEGNKSRIQKSYEVKTHLERALEIYPNDATTWHILGLWHFSFADMGYATRLVAKAVFGTPPTSTYDQALHYFIKAEDIQPGFYSTNTYYIGEVYEKLGRKEEAIEHFMKAFKMPVITADDNVIHTKAHEKLRKAGVKSSQLV